MKLLIFIFFYLSLNISFAYDLTPEEYNALKKMTEEIKKYCPPSDCVYIGVGRSPTPLIAILESDKSNKTIHLPLTYNREFKNNGRELTRIEKNRLFQHFDKFMPSKQLEKKKKILLIDFTLSGDGLDLANSHLDEWSKKRNLNLNINDFAIDLIGEEDTPNRKYISLSDDFDEITEKFVMKKYSQFSRYEQFTVALNSSENNRYLPPIKNSKYNDLMLAGVPLSDLENSCNFKILNNLRHQTKK